MKKELIIFFGLKGSWKWAVRQMKKGHIVTKQSVSGSLKYRLSQDGQLRLENDFSRTKNRVDWETSNFFISDLSKTDWILFDWDWSWQETDYRKTMRRNRKFKTT